MINLKFLQNKGYSSKWILNFGVVPLFLLAAFLFVPCFFVLAFLIVLVCLVLEPILNPSVYIKFRNDIIAKFSCIVKKILILLFLASFHSFSKQNKSNLSQESLFISKGEQKVLRVKKLEHYSIGNSEVLAKRLKYKQGKLFIKGKRVGYTDLVVWMKKKKKKTFHIYVLSKNESLKLAQASSVLEELGMQLKFKGKVLMAKGEVTQKSKLVEIMKIKKILKNQVILEISYSPQLAKELVKDIYLDFQKENIFDYACELKESIRCRYTSQKIRKDIIKKYTKYHIQFDHSPPDLLSQNITLSLHFLQVERSSGKDFSIGLQELSSTVKDILTKGLISLINQNPVKIGEHEYKFQTLAHPQVKAIIGKQGELKVGLDVAFNQVDTQNSIIATQWKETGFKFKYKLNYVKEKLALNYQLHFSNQAQSNINSSYYNGDQFVIPMKIIELLRINVLTSQKQKTAIPILSMIPIVEKLTSSSSQRSTNKLILVFAKVSHE